MSIGYVLSFYFINVNFFGIILVMQKTVNKEAVQWRESSLKALIPFVVFVIFYFGFSVATSDFSRVPMSVAFIISSAVALTLNHKEKLGRKIEIFALGMGHKDIMIMCLIFILAGAFTAAAQAVGAVDAAVSVARNFIPPEYMVSGLFAVSALISLAVGTSCGTIAAIAPIAVNLVENLGISPGAALGATVGGAMFGDNLSLISDTAIASARTQNVEMRDKMFFNLRIVSVPAVLSLFLYALPMFASTGAVGAPPLIDSSSYIKIIPYLFLLVLGVLGVNVMLLLLFGTILSTVIGVYYGIFDIFGAFGFIGEGTVSMANTIIVALLAGGLLQMVRYNGGITYIINSTGKFIKNKKLCEFGICFLVGVINLFTANNTVAIITSGPIAKEISEKYGVNPKRTASLLDTTSCCVQGVIPYGAQILIATSLAASISISSFTIIKGLFYPAMVGVALLISIAFTKK